MNFRKSTNTGTCLQGYLTTTYAELVRLFGEPHKRDGDKTSAEWSLVFSGFVDEDDPDGEEREVTVTIYDWKLDRTPLETYDWHIGGFDRKAVEAIGFYFDSVGAGGFAYTC